MPEHEFFLRVVTDTAGDRDQAISDVLAAMDDVPASIYVVREPYEARAEVERLRGALIEARTIAEDAAAMTCNCVGDYQCGGCERMVADRAQDAVDLIDAAMRQEEGANDGD